MSIFLLLAALALPLAPRDSAVEAMYQPGPTCEAEAAAVLEPVKPLEPQELTCTAPDCSGCPTQGAYRCDCDCQTVYMQCDAACGPMNFPCKLACQQEADDCIDCCSTWEDTDCS